ncbi:MAG: hypothetical protein JST92_22065, partial [Deltaproteobacteria bacterium]|nr:hypothetical protein [Deltaproteobacteria bacterium]
NNISLGDDGVLYYIGGGLQGYALTAVQIWPNKQMSQLYQLASQNNGSFDTLSFPALLPAPTGGHLLVDYYVSGNSGPRFISSYTLGSTMRLKPGAWATQGGDLMHRNSLKVQ